MCICTCAYINMIDVYLNIRYHVRAMYVYIYIYINVTLLSFINKVAGLYLSSVPGNKDNKVHAVCKNYQTKRRGHPWLKIELCN